MTDYQNKQTVSQLLKSTWDIVSSMNFDEAQADELQDSVDKILMAVNNKTKDAVPPPATVTTIDPERKARREKKTKPDTSKKEPTLLKAPRKKKVTLKVDGTDT